MAGKVRFCHGWSRADVNLSLVTFELFEGLWVDVGDFLRGGGGGEDGFNNCGGGCRGGGCGGRKDHGDGLALDASAAAAAATSMGGRESHAGLADRGEGGGGVDAQARHPQPVEAGGAGGQHVRIEPRVDRRRRAYYIA